MPLSFQPEPVSTCNLKLASRKWNSYHLFINGEEKIFAGSLSLAQLIEQLGMKGDRVAAELNRDIVSRTQWAETPLKDGDSLEIVHFVGGG